jgi:membrane-bound lytic murein transglycosylase B
MRYLPWTCTLAACLAFATPALAQQCGGNFGQWKSQIEQEARDAGVGQRGLQALANARVDERVLQRDRGQRFFTQSFTEVAGRLISDDRLQRGRQLLQQHADLFQRAEREYGVPGRRHHRLLGAGDRFRRRPGRFQHAQRAGDARP